MPKPPPDNLGKRQYELNIKVNDAFAKKVDFNKLEGIAGTEVDKFFKIDLAAKCRNKDYIIGILKESETLYVHRALKKCNWIYTDDYSHIINPEYLEKNIFAVTSIRIKRLILKTVAAHIRNENRAVEFYQYCMKIKMTDIAFKYLLFTSEDFKLDLMQNQSSSLKDIISKKFTYIQFIIGKSFVLLEAFMKMLTKDQQQMIMKFKYLYPENNVKYLDLLEMYIEVPDYYAPYNMIFNKEFCEHIMKHHKDRLLAKPIFYLNNIPKEILLRHITVEDAKILIVAILPPTALQFWQGSFHENDGKIFLDLIPHSEKYQFIKKIFNDKYPNDEFETEYSFYSQTYYEYMTIDQREEWALRQIESEKQILGIGADYLWYQFINFNDAFEKIKKYIMVTKEPERRCNMLTTLVQSLRNDSELEILFKYYNKRHINEAIPEKIKFLDDVIFHQNVFEFSDNCWGEFYTIVLSLGIYKENTSDSKVDDNASRNYKNVALFYYILNEKKLPEEVTTFLLDHFYPYTDSCDRDEASVDPLLKKMNDEKRRFLFNYLHTFFTDKIEEYKNKPYTDDGMTKLERYFKIIVKLIKIFNVNPETFEKSHTRPYKRPKVTHKDLSDARLLQDLKTDTKLVIEKLSRVKTKLLENRNVNIDNFLKKIKIYFPNDITENFLAVFEEILAENVGVESLNVCVDGIFKLGSESTKTNLMQEHVPENTKINYNDDDECEKLNIRKAICRNASSSLPPMPLENMLAYLKGDYAKFCLHIFSIYISALPISKCVNLVQSVLDSPVSVQKHALRLAVQCFDVDSLKKIISNIWVKTKNVTLRSVIFKALYNRVVETQDRVLFDILISFTLDIHEDDQVVIFKLVETNELPKDLLPEYKKAVWTAFKEFKDKEPNIGRKIKILNGIISHLNIVDKEFVKTIVDEHLNMMFDEKQLELYYSQEDIARLYVAKWNLTVKYVLINSSEEYVNTAKSIVRSCLKMWHENCSGYFIYRQCFWEFIQNLNKTSIECYTDSVIPVCKGLLSVLKEVELQHEMYLPEWEIQLVICNRQIVDNTRVKQKLENSNEDEVVREATTQFGTEVGKLVLEYVKNMMYFKSLSDKIRDSVVKCVRDLLKVLLPSGSDNAVRLNAALTSVAASLVEFDNVDTYLLAVLVLPSESNDLDEYAQEKYELVMDKILKSNYPEVKSAGSVKLYKPFKRVHPKPKVKRNVVFGRGRGRRRPYQHRRRMERAYSEEWREE